MTQQSNTDSNDWLKDLLIGFRKEIQRSERMIRLDGHAKTLPDIEEATNVVKHAHETIEQAIQSKVDEMVREARVNELEMAIAMKGKTLLAGVIIETGNFEGGHPELVDVTILKVRLDALKAQLSTNKSKG